MTKRSTFLSGLMPGDEGLTEEELFELRRLNSETPLAKYERLNSDYERLNARILEMQAQVKELNRKGEL